MEKDNKKTVRVEIVGAPKGTTIEEISEKEFFALAETMRVSGVNERVIKDVSGKIKNYLENNPDPRKQTLFNNVIDSSRAFGSLWFYLYCLSARTQPT